jgi:hypothetical protein
MSNLRHLLYLCLVVAACSEPDRIALRDLTVVNHFTLDGKGTAYQVVIGDEIAYVSDQAGFRSFRLTDTDAAPLATYIVEPQTPQGNQPLALSGKILAVAHGARIVLVDVSDPAKPVTLSTIEAGSDGAAHGLAFDGDYLYWTGINIKRALVRDPANPGVPQVIAAQQFNTLLIRAGYIYASGPGTLVIFSLPDPNVVNGVAPPVSMASLPQAMSLVLNGTVLYGSAGSHGNLFVVDVADRKAPQVIDPDPAGFDMGGPLVLQGDQLLAPSYTDFTYDYDVSDPQHPVEVDARLVARNYDRQPNYGAARRGDLLLLGNEAGLLVLYPTLR